MRAEIAEILLHGFHMPRLGGYKVKLLHSEQIRRLQPIQVIQDTDDHLSQSPRSGHP